MARARCNCVELNQREAVAQPICTIMSKTYFYGTTVKSNRVKVSTARNFPALVKAHLEVSSEISMSRAEYNAIPANTPAGKAERLNAKDGSYLVACTFDADETSRERKFAEKANCCHLLFLDLDTEKNGFSPAAPFIENPGRLLEAMKPFNFAAYTTASSTSEKPRMRIVVDADSITLNSYPDAVKTIGARIGLANITKESLTPNQPMICPSLFADDDADASPMLATFLEGDSFTLLDIQRGHTFGSDESPATLQSADGDDTGGLEFLKSPDPTATLEVVESALGYISPDCGYQQWFNVVCGLKHQFGGTEDEDAAYALFDEWSAKGSTYESPEATLKKWDNVRANPTDRKPITFGTVHKMAEDNGWQDPRPKQQQAPQSEGSLLDKLDNRRLYLADPPPKPISIYKLAGQQICTAGNITVFSAQAKAGKTAVVGAMNASSLSDQPSLQCLTEAGAVCGDFLGFTGAPHDGKAVIYFDTEQAPYDAWTLLHRAALRAGVKTWPENFRFYSLADVATPERRKMLSLELKRAELECGGLHSVFIDGVADLCLDPNDPAESFGLVEELQRLAIEHHCPVITVLHENPSGAETGKTRGHLGSQLERKAESNLRVFKDPKGICTIYSERCRRASIPKDEGPRFTFDVQAGMHLTYHGDAQEEKQEEKRQQHQSLVDAVFQNAPVHGFIHKDLKKRLLETDSAISDKTARRRIKDWKELGLVQLTPTGKYQAPTAEDFC